MSQLAITVTPTSTNVFVVQPGGSATYTFEIKWSPPPGDVAILPHPVNVTFGVLQAIPGVSVVFSPPSLSLGIAGGEASCKVGISVASNAGNVGPVDAGFWMSFGDGPHEGVPIELTIGQGTGLIEFSSVFNGSLTISNAAFNVGPAGIPANQFMTAQGLTFSFVQQSMPTGTPIAGEFDVAVTGLSSFVATIQSDVLTANTICITGTYSQATGLLDLSCCAFSVSDIQGVLSPNQQTIQFDFSTENSITVQNAGLQAKGSRVNNQGLGTMTLVGGPTALSLSKDGFGGQAPLGIVLTGTFSGQVVGPNPPSRQQTVNVPNVTGKKLTIAESTLSSLGFNYLVTNVPTTNPAAIGVVLSQSPLAGTPEPKGSTVDLKSGVSRGAGGNG
jgi:hypothetical protein